MSDTVEMVTVDGVNYRPEDVPKKAEQKQQPKPANKARTAPNK